MGMLRQIAEYLYLKKKDPNAPTNGYIRAMHGINRISLFMFIIAILVILYRLFFKKH
jgi:hypothetical protein